MSDSCISCGMPLRTDDDHAGKDPSKPYCLHCARPDATLKSFDEVLAGTIGFLKRTQGLDDEVARKTAHSMLTAQPAWRERA